MTLYQAYLNYKRKSKEIEDDFRVRIRESGTPAPEILVDLLNAFASAKEVSTFIHYTRKHPLTIKTLLKFMSETSGTKWSCTAKLTNYIPDHIEESLQDLCKTRKANFESMQDRTFFEIYFHTTTTNPETEMEISFVKPFTISTNKPYKSLKKQKDLLENINFYECLLDGGFDNQNATWEICPDKETQSFLPNVVKNYIRTVQFAENTNEKEK